MYLRGMLFLWTILLNPTQAADSSSRLKFAIFSIPYIEHINPQVPSSGETCGSILFREEFIMSFAERIRFARKERGLSQEEVAEILEVSRQSVTKWETGISFPEIKTLLRLASLLEKGLDWLLYDEKFDGQESFAVREYAPSKERPHIPDRKTLNDIMKKDLIAEILNVLQGYELIREIKTDEFEGTQAVTFYNGRAFSEISGHKEESRETVFSEMSYTDIEELLLPWSTVRKNRISPLPQVVENEL